MEAQPYPQLIVRPARDYLATLPPVEPPGRAATPAYSLAQAYRICHAITRRHSKSFFLATRLLPRTKRMAMEALYAFCRTSDDLVDTHPDPANALARWIAWQQQPVPPPDQPVLIAWADSVTRYRLPLALADELLAGIAMDLTTQRYESFAELWVYCYRVASVVGLLSMRIIGFAPGAEAYAIRLGVALQLTNILRDIGEDARRGRIYLPLEDLRRFGLSEAEVLAGVRDHRFRALLRFEIARAEELYHASWPGIALLHRDGQLAVAAAALLYRGILTKIVANDYDVWTRRAHLSTAEKLAMLPGIVRRVYRLRRGDTRLDGRV